MNEAAEEHRLIAGRFSELVAGVAAGGWDRPAPCEGWVARDVVGHLVDWLPGLLRSGAGVEIPSGPPVSEDPMLAWEVQREAVQALLDDPETATKVLTNPHFGSVPLDQAIARFYTGDVFLHTWDLARATGQDERLDPDRCAAMLEGMLPLDEVLRGSGQYGPKVEVAPDADVQTRLLAFIGRTP